MLYADNTKLYLKRTSDTKKALVKKNEWYLVQIQSMFLVQKFGKGQSSEPH